MTRRFEDARYFQAMRALLDEPADVRERIASKLMRLSREIGDRDRSKSMTMLDIATFLRTGSFIPQGASRD